jgi:putative CocE/NonD family hydrolase
MAISALFAAARRPDDIDAVFASIPMGDAMRGTVGIGGLLNATFMSQWMALTHTLSTQNVITALFNPRYMGQLMRTTREHIDQIDAYHLPLINAALDNDPRYNFDGDFWRLRSPIEQIDRIKAPTFITGALNDIFQRDSGLLYEKLKQNGVDTRLIIHDGTHVVNFMAQHVGNELVPAVDFLMLQWFDHYLKSLDTGVDQIPNVSQYVRNFPTADSPSQPGHGRYVTAEDWPHPQARAHRWYLHAGGQLAQESPTVEQAPVVMTNPAHPEGRAFRQGGLLRFDVAIHDGTECSRSFYQWNLGIAVPQPCFTSTNKTPQQRLLFESEPMTEDYFINGPIQADIWISSTVSEAVVSVALEEVSSRRALPLTDGQLLASKRAVDPQRSRYLDGQMIQPWHYFTQAQHQPLVPGEVVKMSIELFPTAAVIRKGNRMRISISPSNQAQAMLNFPLQALAEGGVTTVHMSPEHPSSVVLPVVPLAWLR